VIGSWQPAQHWKASPRRCFWCRFILSSTMRLIEPNGAGAMSRPVGLYQPVTTAQRLQQSDVVLARLLPAEAAFSGAVSCTSADSLVVAMLRMQGQAQHQPAIPLHHQSSVCSQHSSWCVSNSAPLPSALNREVLQLDSVRRKRASKMNKHKHRKRRRRDRASRK